jgi:glycine hydroxymethyltransferase
VGSAAMTTRGFTEGEAHTIGCLMANAIFKRDDAAALENIKTEVQALIDKYPLYPEL